MSDMELAHTSAACTSGRQAPSMQQSSGMHSSCSQLFGRPRRSQRQGSRGVQRLVAAGMGIGFTQPDFRVESELLVPESPDYGLSVKQMQVLGLTSEAWTKVPEVSAVSGSLLSMNDLRIDGIIMGDLPAF